MFVCVGGWGGVGWGGCRCVWGGGTLACDVGQTIFLYDCTCVPVRGARINQLISCSLSCCLSLFPVPAATAACLQLFEESGTDLAQALAAKDSIAKKKAAMAPDVAKALARLSGGLYIVTAANATARSAMVASWVAQASFEPLGLTIAVAKDRAIESLMQVGVRCAVRGCMGGKWMGLRRCCLCARLCF